MQILANVHGIQRTDAYDMCTPVTGRADLQEWQAREEALQARLRAGGAPPLRLLVVGVQRLDGEVRVALLAGVPAAEQQRSKLPKVRDRGSWTV